MLCNNRLWKLGYKANHLSFPLVREQHSAEGLSLSEPLQICELSENTAYEIALEARQLRTRDAMGDGILMWSTL